MRRSGNVFTGSKSYGTVRDSRAHTCRRTAHAAIIGVKAWERASLPNHFRTRSRKSEKEGERERERERERDGKEVALNARGRIRLFACYSFVRISSNCGFGLAAEETETDYLSYHGAITLFRRFLSVRIRIFVFLR